MDFKENEPKKSMKNYFVSDDLLVHVFSSSHSDLFESIRKHDTSNVEKSHRPKEYAIEIQALDRCCKHRTHCLIHDIIGMIKV